MKPLPNTQMPRCAAHRDRLPLPRRCSVLIRAVPALSAMLALLTRRGSYSVLQRLTRVAVQPLLCLPFVDFSSSQQGQKKSEENQLSNVPKNNALARKQKKKQTPRELLLQQFLPVLEQYGLPPSQFDTALFFANTVDSFQQKLEFIFKKFRNSANPEEIREFIRKSRHFLLTKSLGELELLFGFLQSTVGLKSEELLKELDFADVKSESISNLVVYTEFLVNECKLSRAEVRHYWLHDRSVFCSSLIESAAERLEIFEKILKPYGITLNVRKKVPSLIRRPPQLFYNFLHTFDALLSSLLRSARKREAVKRKYMSVFVDFNPTLLVHSEPGALFRRFCGLMFFLTNDEALCAQLTRALEQFDLAHAVPSRFFPPQRRESAPLLEVIAARQKAIDERYPLDAPRQKLQAIDEELMLDLAGYLDTSELVASSRQTHRPSILTAMSEDDTGVLPSFRAFKRDGEHAGHERMVRALVEQNFALLDSGLDLDPAERAPLEAGLAAAELTKQDLFRELWRASEELRFPPEEALLMFLHSHLPLIHSRLTLEKFGLVATYLAMESDELQKISRIFSTYASHPFQTSIQPKLMLLVEAMRFSLELEAAQATARAAAKPSEGSELDPLTRLRRQYRENPLRQRVRQLVLHNATILAYSHELLVDGLARWKRSAQEHGEVWYTFTSYVRNRQKTRPVQLQRVHNSLYKWVEGASAPKKKQKRKSATKKRQPAEGAG